MLQIELNCLVTEVSVLYGRRELLAAASQSVRGGQYVAGDEQGSACISATGSPTAIPACHKASVPHWGVIQLHTSRG